MASPNALNPTVMCCTYYVQGVAIESYMWAFYSMHKLQCKSQPLTVNNNILITSHFKSLAANWGALIMNIENMTTYKDVPYCESMISWSTGCQIRGNMTISIAHLISGIFEDNVGRISILQDVGVMARRQSMLFLYDPSPAPEPKPHSDQGPVSRKRR